MTKRSGVVGIDLGSLAPKAARKQLEAVSGARLRGWIVRAEVSFTEVARCLGMQRPELYDVMEGVRSFRLAWFELLPEQVRRIALEDLSRGVSCELRPVAESGEDRDAMRLVHESLDVIRTVTEALADGAIDAREAQAMLREIDDVDAAMAATRARLRTIVAEHDAAMRRLS